ncbi:MAG: hypothetical protein JSW44_04815 [Candidatus Bathyarchaeota archaeon]|nr:MAG: hypothetical protein JSW44_04815 [Candidatus Bathyarchaeota archaeon]
MLSFDVTMPTALFVVTLVAILLDRRIEGKLKTTFQERKFRMRDAILFVAMISVAVSVIMFVPQMAIIVVFLFSYSTLLFTFSYIFSGIRKRRAQLFCLGFGLAALVAGSVALLHPFADSWMFYGGLATYGLAAFAFFATLYEQMRKSSGERWYLAVLPPALFLLSYLFFKGTLLWFPYFFNIFAITFAILITLFLGSLFTWKITFIFAGLLTVMDIILVFGTGTMGTAATTLLDLGLPIAVVLPRIPIQGAISFGGLGLGDFFFAGILATQTHKKFGDKTAAISALVMAISLGLFHVIQLYSKIEFFPATVSVICGWLPVVAWKLVAERKTKSNIVIQN